MKVIIIEDEQFTANLLQSKILSIDSTISIIAKLSSIQEAINHIQQNGFPDLFFSDIELTDGLSFEIFKQLNNKTPIIFCTAYNQYAIDAFRVYGIEYLLKPFDTNDIKQALSKYQKLVRTTESIDYSTLLNLLNKQEETKVSSILIYKGEEILPIKVEDIAVAGIDHGVVYIYTFNQKKYATQQNMEQLFDLLNDDFYRINRQYIINRAAVATISQYFGRKLQVYSSIKLEDKLLVSKANVKEFLSWLETR